MTRLMFVALTLASVAFLTPTASAQFLYLRPNAVTPGTYSLVFHSSPISDPATPATALGVTTATAVAEGGKQSQVAFDPADKSVTVKTSAETLFVSAEYGVSNRGEGHLVLLHYHAKSQPLGGVAVGLPLELTPKAVSGGVAFVATGGGKPLANTTVVIHEPGTAESRTVTTDADGQTPTYTKAGRYAARVGRFEKKKGEFEGKAYTGIWEYSTVVTDVK